MPFNINSFKANIESFGYMPINKFEVIIRPPDTLLGGTISGLDSHVNVADTIRLLKFRAGKVTCPVTNLETLEVQRYGLGMVTDFTWAGKNVPFGISFLEDKQGSVQSFFYNWSRSIFGFNGTEEAYTTQQFSQFPNNAFEYREKYSTSMQIIEYNHYGNKVQIYNIHEAFPVRYKPHAMSWEADGLKEISVSFTYKEYTLTSAVDEEQGID